jgi:hypothetical protein
VTRSGKRVAIVQSSYIPWKGYFDLMRAVDEFILLDEVQFTKRDWRSRNRIKTPQGPLWLSIPVQTKGRFHQSIQETEVSDPGWAANHWRSISTHYAKAPYFAPYREAIAALFERTETRLSEINRRMIEGLAALLDIRTTLTWSMDYASVGSKTDRLVSLCEQAGATGYLSGPSAGAYLDRDRFAAAGITVQYADYHGYPEYPQLYPPFEHAVSAIDLVVNTGPQASAYMKDLWPR